MIAYASRTGTKVNLDMMRARGWCLLVSATGVHRTEGFPYALDNGAWTAHQAGEEWSPRPFCELLDKLGAEADWCALPDIVGGGLESLVLSLRWRNAVLDQCRMALLPVQNGMTVDDVRPHLGPRVGIFVGGDDNFKEGTMRTWAALAREVGTYCHVGRVNTPKRIRMCARAGVDSFDGTSGTRFAKTIPRIDSARKQLAFGVRA